LITFTIGPPLNQCFRALECDLKEGFNPYPAMCCSCKEMFFRWWTICIH